MIYQVHENARRHNIFYDHARISLYNQQTGLKTIYPFNKSSVSYSILYPKNETIYSIRKSISVDCSSLYQYVACKMSHKT